MKRTSVISAIVLIALSSAIYGCGNNNSAPSARKEISSPSEALIGHWSGELSDTNLYFDGELFQSYAEIHDSAYGPWYYKVIQEDPVEFVVDIEVELDEEMALSRIFRIAFSDDRNRISMYAWDESEQAFVETELSKNSIIYIDDKKSP